MIITKFDVANAVKKYYKENTTCFVPYEKICFGDLEKVSKNIAFGIPKEKIVAVMDVGFFKTCKKGFVLTADKLYFSGKYHIVGEKGKYFIDFTDLYRVEMNRNDNYNVITFIYNNKKEIDFYAGLEARDVYDVFSTLTLRKIAEKERFDDFAKEKKAETPTAPANKPADTAPIKSTPTPKNTAISANEYKKEYDQNFSWLTEKVHITPYVIDPEFDNPKYSPAFMVPFHFNGVRQIAVNRHECKLNDIPSYAYTLIDIINGQVNFLVVQRISYTQIHFYLTPRQYFEKETYLIRGRTIYQKGSIKRQIPLLDAEVTVCMSLGGNKALDLKTNETIILYNTDRLDSRLKLPVKNDFIIVVREKESSFMIQNIEMESSEFCKVNDNSFEILDTADSLRSHHLPLKNYITGKIKDGQFTKSAPAKGVYYKIRYPKANSIHGMDYFNLYPLIFEPVFTETQFGYLKIDKNKANKPIIFCALRDKAEYPVAASALASAVSLQLSASEYVFAEAVTNSRSSKWGAELINTYNTESYTAKFVLDSGKECEFNKHENGYIFCIPTAYLDYIPEESKNVTIYVSNDERIKEKFGRDIYHLEEFTGTPTKEFKQPEITPVSNSISFKRITNKELIHSLLNVSKAMESAFYSQYEKAPVICSLKPVDVKNAKEEDFYNAVCFNGEFENNKAPCPNCGKMNNARDMDFLYTCQKCFLTFKAEDVITVYKRTKN